VNQFGADARLSSIPAGDADSYKKQAPATSCGAVRLTEVDGVGFEPMPKTSGNNDVTLPGDVKSDVHPAAGGAEKAPIDPDLQVILERWPHLPDSVKSDILTMVREAGE